MPHDDPLDADDHVIQDPPAWLPDPVERWLADLTYREWHAAVLGLVGVLPGGAAALGSPIGLAAAALVTTATLRKARKLGELWYWAVPLVVTTVATYAVGWWV